MADSRRVFNLYNYLVNQTYQTIQNEELNKKKFTVVIHKSVRIHN